MHAFTIQGIDYISLRVSDIALSTAWYETVLGLHPFHPEEWPDNPKLLLSGSSGILLYPAKLTDPEIPQDSKQVKIEQLSFRLDASQFDKAIHYFKSIGQTFVFEDHVYYQTITLSDPDGHRIALNIPVKEINTTDAIEKTETTKIP